MGKLSKLYRFFHKNLCVYFSTPWQVDLIAVLTFFNGLLALLEEFFFHSNNFSTLLLTVTPFGLFHRSSLLTVVLGFTLIYLSYHIHRRKIVAWWAIIGMLIIISSVDILHAHPVYFMTALLTLVLLFEYRQYFTVRYARENIFQGVRLAAGSFLLAVLCGTAGFWFLDQREFGINFHLSEALLRTLREYLLLGNSDLVPHSHYATHFLELLRFLGISALSLAAYSVFLPIYELQRYGLERQAAAEILDKFGRSSLDYFKLWPSKHYFFNKNKTSFISFELANGVAMALGDPIGPTSETLATVEEFIHYTRDYGWRPAFYCVTAEFCAICKVAKLNYLRIGQEAFIDLAKFVTELGPSKDFSRIVRKFEKRGYSFICLEPPHSSGMLEKLKMLSDEWLKKSGRHERNFTVGYFDEEYLSECRIFVVEDAQGEIIAFANEIPSWKTGEATIDLMRHKLDALNGTMDFLFIKMFFYFFAKGYKTFDLGLSPISKENTFPSDSLKEKALQEIYKNASILFSFEGIYNYKKKFQPIWEDRFLVYAGSPVNLITSTFTLSKLTRSKNYNK